MWEIEVSSFSDFCNSFLSLAAENWKERRLKEVLALGMTSEIYLLECVLRVGVIVTSELRYYFFTFILVGKSVKNKFLFSMTA